MNPSVLPLKLRCALAICALAALQSASAQNATTTPVGYITINVNGGTPAAPKVTLVAPSLVGAVQWQGATANTGVTPSQFTVIGTPWSANQFNGANGTHYVEIASGANSGAWSYVTATTGNSVTTQDDLSSLAVGGDTIAIRKCVTLADFFGANNEAGLLAGDELSLADEVLVYDGLTPQPYFFYDDPSDIDDGWYDADGVLANTAAIGPNQPVLIKRKAGGLTFKFVGHVKKGPTFIPVETGTNIIPIVRAAGVELNLASLYTGNTTTGVKPGDELALADELLVYNSSSISSYYYYDDPADVDDGWYDADGILSNTITLQEGTSIVLKRKTPGNAFNWIVPGPPGI